MSSDVNNYDVPKRNGKIFLSNEKAQDNDFKTILL